MAPDHDQLDELVTDLTAAHSAAQAIGDGTVIGVRAVEARPGVRHYMCAFDDGRIGCVDRDLQPVPAGPAVSEVLRVALLIEHTEEALDVAAMQVMIGEATTARTVIDDRTVRAAVDALIENTTDLIAWREDPTRAVARMSALDEAITRHDAIRKAHIAFIAATDPLVPIQDTLSTEVRGALRELEIASAAAGVAGNLTPLLAGALPAIDTGVDELLERYWRPPAGQP